MAHIQDLQKQLLEHFGEQIIRHVIHVDQLTITVPYKNIREICCELRDNEQFDFQMLIDLCGVDYLVYGCDEWKTTSATLTGFSRGVTSPHHESVDFHPKSRFAVTYHLLSLEHNHRLRVKAYISEEPIIIDSVIDVWPAANWFEREAFDLYGILFKGHPDLRRILTDYGFIGHPFRKDFPLIGNVEMRYDATTQRCIYEPVGINPRTLVPKVIREDNRYLETEEEGNPNG